MKTGTVIAVAAVVGVAFLLWSRSAKAAPPPPPVQVTNVYEQDVSWQEALVTGLTTPLAIFAEGFSTGYGDNAATE